jgi:lipocalin
MSARSQEKPSVVANVDLKRYKGIWYEIARLLRGQQIMDIILNP